MHDSPIMMSAPMVKACLRQVRGEPGGKTVARRMPTKQWDALERRFLAGEKLALWVRENIWQASPYPGTLPSGDADDSNRWSSRLVHYAADGTPPNCANRHYGPDGLRNGAYAAPNPYAIWLFRPSIHMPRWASRLTLLDVTIRRERLGDISEVDALAEGVVHSRRFHEYENANGVFEKEGDWWSVPGFEYCDSPMGADDCYATLWETLHGPGSWDRDADKEIMVIGFRPVLGNIDQIGEK